TAQSTTEREAILACVYHDMIDRNKSPSCVSMIGFGIFRFAINSVLEQKLDALKKKGDPWLELLSQHKIGTVPSDVFPVDGGASLVSLSVEGSIHAATRFLQISSLRTPKERDQLKTVANVIEKAVFRDDRVYVVSEEFFRIIDKMPTRRDLVRSKLLLALA